MQALVVAPPGDVDSDDRMRVVKPKRDDIAQHPIDIELLLYLRQQ